MTENERKMKYSAALEFLKKFAIFQGHSRKQVAKVFDKLEKLKFYRG